jgi:hypothetical protein
MLDELLRCRTRARVLVQKIHKLAVLQILAQNLVGLGREKARKPRLLGWSGGPCSQKSDELGSRTRESEARGQRILERNRPGRFWQLHRLVARRLEGAENLRHVRFPVAGMNSQ